MRPERWLTALVVSTLCLQALPAASDSPLSVIVIDICSARADHFGLYGYSRSTTPEIDALAKEGIVFDQAISQSSWCLPNYAALFTGHEPEVNGQYTNIPFRSLPAFETTIAERLRDRGFATGAFSGGVYMMPAWGLDKGFTTYVNSYSTSTNLPTTLHDQLPGILKFAKESQGPFFLYVGVDDLHAPYQADDPDRFDREYSGIAHDTETHSVKFFRAYNGEPVDAGDPIKAKVAAFRKDPKALAHLTAHYDASLLSVDRDVGGLVRKLKAEGLWDKAMVIVTADHGELLGEHGMLGHTESLYEPVLKVPLLIHDPSHPGQYGTRSKALVRRLDLTPTILDAAGADYDDLELQGLSLAPLLRDSGAPSRRDYAYASSKRNRADLADFMLDERVLRGAEWKLHWYSYKDGFELYNIKDDPGELRDLADARPDVVSKMAFTLLNKVERTRPHAPGLPSGNPSARRGVVMHADQIKH